MKLDFDIKPAEDLDSSNIHNSYVPHKVKNVSSSDTGVVVARKNCHKGALIGHVSNGGGIVPLSDNFSLRFVASDKFCELELLATGSKPKYQNWQKAKKVIEKQTVIKKVDKTPVDGGDFKMGEGKTI